MEEPTSRGSDEIASILLPCARWDGDRLGESITTECQTPLSILLTDDLDIGSIDGSSMELSYVDSS